MTITTETADQVLRTAYLDVISNYLNNSVNPFFAKIKKTSDNVWGKEIKKIIRMGHEFGIVAGSEDGELPESEQIKYKEFVIGLKNLYGTIEISDKALRAAQNKSGAFTNMLNDEIEALMQSANENFSRMLFGDGCGTLARFNELTDGGYLIVDDASKLRVGMKVQIADCSHILIHDGRIYTLTEIDKLNSYVKTEPAITSYDFGDVCTIHPVNSYNNELTGLEAIFDKNYFMTLYGVEKEENPELLPEVYDNVTQISEMKIQKAIDNIKDKFGTDVNFILCSSGVKRALIDHMNTYKRTMDVMDIQGGYKTISFNGIPVVSNKYCPIGTMYLLNTDDFAIHQLCDWEWLEGDNGKILRQLPNKPVYRATLVKYAELLCSRPWAQAKLSGIIES